MKPKVISYFSYKGGAGRSTLAYNTIPLLLNECIQPTKSSPVVIVDMDIDSCGLSYLLGVQADQIAYNTCLQTGAILHLATVSTKPMCLKI